MPPISLAPPVSDVSGKVSVTKITTVLSCVKKVSFEPPVSDEKVSVTKNEHTTMTMLYDVIILEC